MSNPVANQRLERRLEYAAADFLALDATLAAVSQRQRDSTSLLTPETADKTALILLHARDDGRVALYAPIRNLRLRLTIRVNAKTTAGEPEALDALTAALEAYLDESNLLTGLDSASRGVRVMKAVRIPGIGFQVEGFIKRVIFELNVACVRSEQTGTAEEAAWVDGDGTLMVDGDGTQLVF